MEVEMFLQDRIERSTQRPVPVPMKASILSKKLSPVYLSIIQMSWIIFLNGKKMSHINQKGRFLLMAWSPSVDMAKSSSI